MPAEIPPDLAEEEANEVAAATSPELREALARWRPLPAATGPSGSRWWGAYDPVSRAALMDAWIAAPGIVPKSTRKTSLSNHIYALAEAAAAAKWCVGRYGPGPAAVGAAKKSAAVISGGEADGFGRLLGEVASPLGRYVISFAASAESIRPDYRPVRDKTRSAVDQACGKVRELLIAGDGDRPAVLSTDLSATTTADLVQRLSEKFDLDPKYTVSEAEAELVSWSLQWALRFFVVRMEDLLLGLQDEPQEVRAMGMTQAEISGAMDKLTEWTEHYGVALLPEANTLAEYLTETATRLMKLIYADPKLIATTYGAPQDLWTDTHETETKPIDLTNERDVDALYATMSNRANAIGERASELAVGSAVRRAALRARTGIEVSDHDLTLCYLGSYSNARRRLFVDDRMFDDRFHGFGHPDGDEGSTLSDWLDRVVNPETALGATITLPTDRSIAHQLGGEAVGSPWGNAVREDPRNESHAEWHLICDAAAAWISKDIDSATPKRNFVENFGWFAVSLALEGLSKDIGIVIDAVKRGPIVTREVAYRYEQGRPHDALGCTPEDSVYLISQLLWTAFIDTGYDFDLSTVAPDADFYWDELGTDSE